MSRRRIPFFALLGYMFTVALVLPLVKPSFSESFGGLVAWVALGSVPMSIFGTAVGAAALDGAERLLALMSGRSGSKEEARGDMLRGLALVVGVLLYSLFVAHSRYQAGG